MFLYRDQCLALVLIPGKHAVELGIVGELKADIVDDDDWLLSHSQVALKKLM